MELTRKEALQYIHDNPQQYLQKARVEGYICPICGSGSGPNGTGITTKDGKRYTCWAGKCFTSADIPDIIAAKEGLTPGSREALQRAYEVYSLTVGKKLPSTGENKPSVPPAQKEQKAAQDFTAYIEECHARIGQTDYPQRRGFTKKIIERFRLGYEPNFRTKETLEDGTERFVTWKALIIPNLPYGYKARNTNPDAADKVRPRGIIKPFNLQALEQQEKPVFIVEGELDALSIAEVGGEAVALGGTGNVEKLLAELPNYKITRPLLLALDKDEAGRNAEEKLASSLRERGLPFLQADITGEYKDANEAYNGPGLADFALAVSAAMKAAKTEQEEALEAERGRQAEKDLAKALGDKGIPYIQADIYGAYNDANEMYTKDLAGFASALSTTISGLKAAQDEAKQAAKAEYMSNTAAAHMQGFDEYIKARTNRKPLTTGFSQLDGYMGGGIYEGLYFIGGITSSGKTALGMQIADNLAEQGQDVIIFSLEMSRYELMARSISRLTFKNCPGIDTSNAKAARAILDGAFNSDAERQLYQVSRAQYLDFNEHIHIHEGVGDIGVNHIRQTVERHISFTNTRPVILVDYLQILAPYNERYTDKQNTDKAVTELKRISRDCQIPVIAISSLNRDNYKNEVGYTAFKESGAIEYSCDVLLGLQYKNITTPGFNEDAEAKKNPRTMQVKILKQRLAPKGNTVDFNYFAFANYFAEIKMPGR